jgi:hypothetical protein
MLEEESAELLDLVEHMREELTVRHPHTHTHTHTHTKRDT